MATAPGAGFLSHMNLRSGRVFYGWWIVSAMVLISAYVAGVIFFGFTAVFEPIADEYGWSYAQISFAASIRGLEMSLLAPLVVFLIDRWRPRRRLPTPIWETGVVPR
ncbi:hypothetical protein ACFLYF_05835 [Chloroflexota bacterium]